MKKAVGIAMLALTALGASTQAVAAAQTRPAVVSFAPAMANASGTLPGSARAGLRTGTQSRLDDGGGLILLIGGLVGGYFLYKIIHGDDNKEPDPTTR